MLVTRKFFQMDQSAQPEIHWCRPAILGCGKKSTACSIDAQLLIALPGREPSHRCISRQPILIIYHTFLHQLYVQRPTDEQTDLYNWSSPPYNCRPHHTIVIIIIIIIIAIMGAIQSVPFPLDCLSSYIQSYHTLQFLFQFYLSYCTLQFYLIFIFLTIL